MASLAPYALRVSEVFGALETLPDGLDPAEAQARLLAYGRNVLAEPPGVPLWRRFVGHITHLMALLLWAAGGLAILGGRPTLGTTIWIVVLVNGGFSFWQEYRAEQAVAALKQLLPAYARAIRASIEVQIPASEVAPGDVLVLAEGDNIPADARVVEEYGLRTNHATLTGDAIPVRKVAEASVHEGLTELEQPNLVFAGTSVVSGTGRAVVFATGMLTQFGRIAHLTQAVQEEPSLLQQEMRRVTRIISLVAIGLGVLVFLVASTDVGMPRIEAFLFAIGTIVAVVPEGLLPTITISLAMAVQRLTQRGVLVKKLAVLETLGTVSVICADKSGTLTQNQMTVREMWVAGQRLSVSGVGYEPQGEFSPVPSSTLTGDLKALLTAAILCNNSRLNPPSPEHPQWTSRGDQTEAALRVVALKGGIDERAVTLAYPRVHELAFDARRKRMSTIHQIPNPKPVLSSSASLTVNSEGSQIPNQIAFVKGAPREVLQLCTHILIHGQVRPLDDATRAEILAANDDYARNALRVLALARTPPLTPPPSGGGRGGYIPEKIEQNLIFLGLLAMMDPPRPEIAAAVQTCRAADIRLVMVTGDYGLTAESVARRIGMLATPRPRILTGAEIEAMDDTTLQAALDEEVILARMAPEHKLRLVAAFQARGEVVAVTGDGVNDAPALRKADIGIAMGVAGTEVAKESSDIILTDDNLAAMVSAIEEGRAVYDNIRKFITYIFASNVPEIIPLLLTALFKIPLALTVVQMLAIDLGTDLLPALALGTEKPELGVMDRPPRRRTQSLIDSGLLTRAFLWLGGIEAVLCYIGFFWVYRLAGYTHLLNLPRLDLLSYMERLTTPEGRAYVLATTVFHAGVVTAQIGNVFACRMVGAGFIPASLLGQRSGRMRWPEWLGNRFLVWGIAAEVFFILLMVYFSPLAGAFEHLPLPPIYWLGLGLFAPVLYGLDWIRKSLARRVEWTRECQRQG